MRASTLGKRNVANSKLRRPLHTNPSSTSIVPRRSILRYMEALLRPCSCCLASEKGNEIPAMNRKSGNMVSWCTSPSHGTCCMCLETICQKAESGKRLAMDASNEAPPVMKNMSKPRKASRDSRRSGNWVLDFILHGFWSLVQKKERDSPTFTLLEAGRISLL